MAQEFQTSFIPKKTFDVGTAPTRRSQATLSGLIFFIAVVIFIVSVLGAAGTYLYGKYLESAITTKKENLERAKNAFEPELIRDLARLDTKLRLAQQLIDRHVAPSGIFDLLESLTLETVRFKTMNYEVDQEGVHLRLEGEGRSFASVALESDEFGKNRSIKEPVFSNFDLNEKGDVKFSVEAIIDPALISYKEQRAHAGTAMFQVDPATDTPQVAGAATTTLSASTTAAQTL
jgi:hypothetical protein